MMTYTCDRCGKEIVNNDPSTVDVLRGQRTDDEREIMANLDLCRACERELLVFLKVDPLPDLRG